jgi:hypothetical protein
MKRVCWTRVCGVDEYAFEMVILPRALDATSRWPVPGGYRRGLGRINELTGELLNAPSILVNVSEA